MQDASVAGLRVVKRGLSSGAGKGANSKREGGSGDDLLSKLNAVDGTLPPDPKQQKETPKELPPVAAVASEALELAALAVPIADPALPTPTPASNPAIPAAADAMIEEKLTKAIRPPNPPQPTGTVWYM